MASEYFRDDYLSVTTAPIQVIVLVDYDTLGWIIGHAIEDQFKFFGLQTSRPLRFLVTGDTFTEEEKRLYARPLPDNGKGLKAKNAKWVRESGGVDGKELGIHSNHVQPYERVRELFRRALES